MGDSVVSFVIGDGVHPHGLPDGMLKHRGLEQCRAIGYAGDGLVRLEHHAGHLHVELLALLQVEPQTAQHDGNEAACAGADDQVEVVTWLGNLVATRGFPFDLDVGAVHELLEDDEHGIAANSSAILLALARRHGS